MSVVGSYGPDAVFCATWEANHIARLKDHHRPLVDLGEVNHVLDSRTFVGRVLQNARFAKLELQC